MGTPRDRSATSHKILAAARQLVLAQGMPGLGINAIAKTAGCDKVLIYRYFGGLEGVLKALADQVARTVQERSPSTKGRKTSQTPYGDLVPNKVAKAVDAWHGMLETDAFLLAVARAEMSLTNDLTKTLAGLRDDFLSSQLKTPEKTLLAGDLARGGLGRLRAEEASEAPPPPDLSSYAVMTNPPLRKGKTRVAKKPRKAVEAEPVAKERPEPVELPVELL